MSICLHSIQDMALGHLLLKDQYVLSSPLTLVQLTGFTARYNKSTRDVTLSGCVSVKNQGYDKHIVVVYTTDAWKTQREVVATYEAHSFKRAVFTFTAVEHVAQGTPGVNVSAYIRFHNNGDLQFDNNKGENYNYSFPLHENVDHEEQPLAVVHTSTMSIHAHAATFSVIFGTVSAANWSPEKKVMVRYTHDNWETSSEVQATFCCVANGRDNFVFEYANIADSGVNTSYCVRYETCGAEFWDGNSGFNFTFASLVPASA